MNGLFNKKEILCELNKLYQKKIDLKIINIKMLPHWKLNPKTYTMFLDKIYLWKRNFNLRLDYPTKLFILFLEIERYRNKMIFEGKKMTKDYVKKMPGGRRSYDEIVWLNKILNKDSIPIVKKNITSKNDLIKASKYYDFMYFKLLKKLNINYSTRGKDLIYHLDTEIAEFLLDTTNHLKKFISVKDLSTERKWLSMYALSANNNLNPKVGIKISKLDIKNVFVDEFKKNLLQNTKVKFNPIILKNLSKDKNPLIKLYSSLILNPSLREKQSSFIKDNINHIL